MSVIQKSSPLNLMGKVAIVTSASTPLGAQTCRTLLRHNCLVLGIDDKPIPDSERLFSASGTHFQRLQLDCEDDTAVDQIVEYCKDRFWKEGLDILVTFSDGKDIGRFRRAIGQIIADSAGGVLLHVLSEGACKDDSEAFDLDKGKAGVRGYVVNLNDIGCEDNGARLQVPDGAIDEVEDCVRSFQTLKSEDEGTDRGNKGIAHLLLYTVSDLGTRLDGVVPPAVVPATLGETHSL